MRKFICALLVAFMMISCFAGAENAFVVPNAMPDNANTVGALYVDAGADAIPIIFQNELQNVAVSHTSGASLTLKTVRPGDAILVYSYIPDTIPNLSVSYSYPDDTRVYTKMISQSGCDASYLILDTPEAEMAWQTVLTMKEIISDKAYLEAMSASPEVMGLIVNAAKSIPDEMPDNYYYIDIGMVQKALFETEEFNLSVMNDAAREWILKSIPTMLITSLNARLGVTWVAAGSMMATEDVTYTPEMNIASGLIVFDTGAQILPVAAVSMPKEDITSIFVTCIMRDILGDLDEMLDGIG